MEELIEDSVKTEQPYKKLIFEKNIYTSVCNFFKNYKKIYIITSPTPREKYLQFLINVMNENKINYWITVLNKNAVCDKDTILKTCSKSNNADLIVSFGAGTVTDIVKITAHNLNLPYCVIPTTITHYGILNNIGYLSVDKYPSIVETDYPVRVFIDEDLVKKSPEKFIYSTICFSLAYTENLFVVQTKKKLVGENNLDMVSVSKKIQKIEELLNWVSLSKDFALLNLMDYIIDLADFCKGEYQTNSIFYSLMLNCSTLKNNFGEKCLFSCSILLNLYLMFFGEKNILISLPEREKILKYLDKNDDFFWEYMQKTNPYLDLEFEVSAKKEGLAKILKLYIEHIDKFSKKLLLVNGASEIRMIDENELYSSLATLPYLHNNFLLNIVSRYGYMNF